MASELRYVSRIDPATNMIQLGWREDLETTTFLLERVTRVWERAGGPRGTKPSAPMSGSVTAQPRWRPPSGP